MSDDSPVVVEIALTTDELHDLIDELERRPIDADSDLGSALATLRCVLALAEHHGVPTGPSGAGGPSRDLYPHMSDRDYQDCRDAGRVI